MISLRGRFFAVKAVSDSQSPTPASQLLARAGQGDPESLDRLFPLVYRELHRLAHRCLRSNRAGATMQTTALINEAYIRLVGGSASWNDRVHFLAIASRAMRAILVDTIRSQGRGKRGGGRLKVTFNEELLPGAREESIVALDQALTRLAEFDARKCRVVELHYFGGLTWDEIAAELKISVATVHRDLRMAEAWLAQQVRPG
jgi:RNA polymerase sigma factor (TIGR02999 family)